MKLFYFTATDGTRNFGDDLNAWLWPRLLPEFFDDIASELFVGIGTILDMRIPQDTKAVIFGTGYRPHPDSIPIQTSPLWDVRFVRGPLSASILNCRYVTDPAYYLRLLDFPPTIKKYPVSFVPWFRHDPSRWVQITLNSGIHVIDPRQSVDKVIQDIRSSELILAESMHGAIVADAFRIPWIPIQSRNTLREGKLVNSFKWLDWLASIKATPTIRELQPLPQKTRRAFWRRPLSGRRKLVSELRTLASSEGYMSTDRDLKLLMEQLREELDLLCKTYGIHSSGSNHSVVS